MTDELTIACLGLARDALAGQVAVVTGAGRGIGRETARALAYLGAAVVVADIDPQTAEQTRALIAEEGGRALCCPVDVADEASVAAFAAHVVRECGRVDALFNNAVYCPVASLVDMDAALWDRVLAVNLRGTFLMCRAFLPAMLAQGRGTIVNMTSSGDMPGLSAYFASKHGIEGLSRTLASEVGPRGIRVIAFLPGMVDTPAIRSIARDLAPRLGLTEQQFLGMSMHPAYEGLMPAADAGAAGAYLVARLAGEYHGEVVEGYTLLERAGYLQAPGLPPAAPAAEPPAALQQAGAADRALALARKLSEYVSQTGAEFDRLPFFARPMARGDFGGKAGQSVGDWERTAADLVARLERAQAGDAAGMAELRAGHARLAGLLERFAAYCRAVPAGAARFTKDQEFLRQVAEIAAEREATVGALTTALREMLGG